MSMSPGGMADDVISALASAGLTETPDHRWWQAVCQGIITHIAANMVVHPLALTGPSLSNPAGQPVEVSGPIDGTTTAPQVIIGTGSAS